MLVQLPLDPLDQLVGGEGVQLDAAAQRKSISASVAPFALSWPRSSANGLVVASGAAVRALVVDLLALQPVASDVLEPQPEVDGALAASRRSGACRGASVPAMLKPATSKSRMQKTGTPCADELVDQGARRRGR